VSHEIFADEIAIDFPAVDRLIDRVRSSFLGEAPVADTLTTEVWVSSSDASTGTIVPLDLRLRRLCPACGGRGECWSEPCSACLGSGDSVVHHPVHFPVPPGVADGARFHFRVSSPDAAPVRVEVRVAIRSL